MNEGLTQNPLQQLWVFWISPVLAAAVVALVMIIAQMMTTPKVPAAADLPQTDADANADTLDDGDSSIRPPRLMAIQRKKMLPKSPKKLK